MNTKVVLRESARPSSTPPKSAPLPSWSRSARMSRAWRLGGVPLRVVAGAFRSILSRIPKLVQAVRVAFHRTAPQDKQPVTFHTLLQGPQVPAQRAFPTRGGGTLGRSALDELAQSVRNALCMPTEESVNQNGYFDTFIKDTNRELDIRCKMGDSQWSLQSVIPKDPNGKALSNSERVKSIETQMLAFGKAHFEGDPALMAVFSRVANQGSVVGVCPVAPALLNRCDFDTPADQRPGVFMSNSKMSFELAKCEMDAKKASLIVKMKFDTGISAISEATSGGMEMQEEGNSRLVLDYEIQIDVDRAAASAAFARLREHEAGRSIAPRECFPSEAIKIRAASGSYSYALSPQVTA